MKKNRKKSHNAEKLKGGPFGIFQHPFCRKISKIEGGPKITEPKILLGGTLWPRSVS